jgi:hypothetical protein
MCFFDFVDWVWEIVARREPHLNIDIIDVIQQIRWVSDWLFSNYLFFAVFDYVLWDLKKYMPTNK